LRRVIGSEGDVVDVAVREISAGGPGLR